MRPKISKYAKLVFSPTTARVATWNRISVGIDEADFAQIQLTDAGFDFGAVSNHHPYDVIGMDYMLGGVIQIAGL